MCAPAQAQKIQNNIPLIFFCWDTHISARGTTCAPSKNMCVPAHILVLELEQKIIEIIRIWSFLKLEHKDEYAYLKG